MIRPPPRSPLFPSTPLFRSRRPPRDLPIRLLERDLSVPLVLLPADLRHPVNVGVVELLDGLHVVHELREILELRPLVVRRRDRKSTRLNSSHANISYAVFCL